MTTTIRSSIRVKPFLLRICVSCGLEDASGTAQALRLLARPSSMKTLENYHSNPLSLSHFVDAFAFCKGQTVFPCSLILWRGECQND